MSPTTAMSRPASTGTPQKGVLFCPECWHESPVGGDWQIQAAGADDRLECPACGTTVAVRPRASTATASITLPVVACGTMFARLASRQLAWVRRQCTTPGVKST